MSIKPKFQYQRQAAFQKLRPVCVELNSIILNFKAKQATVRDVFRALEAQYRVLNAGDVRSYLYNKLADYARVPLFEVFNEAQRLSAPCLEVAVQSLTLLVSHGWGPDLNSDVGKQLLILMSVFSGKGPGKQTVPTSNELTCASFRCIQSIVRTLATSPNGTAAFAGQPTKNVIDTLVYLLAEYLSESADDNVQTAACDALFEIYRGVADRVLLASLLPRTMSASVAATKISTKQRRTQTLLSHDVKLIEVILRKVLADSIAMVQKVQTSAELEALGESWLQAVAPQVRTGLVQVAKLRSHDRLEVRQALSALCIMVLEECRQTLNDSVSVMLETLLVLSGNEDDQPSKTALRHLIFSQPELGDMLRETFFDWIQTLPRIMQGNEDDPKKRMLARITNSVNLMNETIDGYDIITAALNQNLLNSVSIAIDAGQSKSTRIQESTGDPFQTLVRSAPTSTFSFEPIILSHQSQKDSTQQLQKLITAIQSNRVCGPTTRNVVDAATNSRGVPQLAAFWLGLKLLQRNPASDFALDDILVATSNQDRSMSRPYLVHDLYMTAKDHLISPLTNSDAEQVDWRLQALSLEALILQAQQLGENYRSELYETLYPILSLFSAPNAALQHHAVTALNLLASACEYSSAKEMLIQNVDYLVNSIAWKLNTFALSPEAPQVLLMIVRLIGAKLIPHLDDLISNIFAALDNYHGYPQWVEMLFAVLQAMIDESSKQPDVLFKDATRVPNHTKIAHPASTIADILADIQQRRERKLDHASDITESQDSAPHRPWTRSQDDPTYVPPEPEPSADASVTSLLEEQEQGDDQEDILPPAKSSADENKDDDSATSTKPLNKTHDLLLQIAEATIPHLSSPSPRARHLILQLLSQVTPVLCRHENTFLPLINSIWPSLVTRLFASSSLNANSSAAGSVSLTISSQTQSRDFDLSETPEETVYNVIAAAEVITSLCKHAGDFMASRVESILSDLTRSYKDTLAKVDANRRRHAESTAVRVIPAAKYAPPSAVTVVETSSSAPSQPLRTSSSQLLVSLVELITTVLTHVSLHLDRSDEIFTLLIPIAVTVKRGADYSLPRQGRGVLEVMELYNAGWLGSILDTVETE